MCLCEAMKPCVMQVQFRAASKPSGRQAVLQRRQRRRCSQQPAPADDSAK